MEVWVKVPWRAVIAARAALKALAIRLHVMARMQKNPDAAKVLRKDADEADEYSEAFAKALHDPTKQGGSDGRPD